MGADPVRVLLVEDDAAISGMVELAFSHEGYAVQVEGDAWGAERAATSFAPDLAVLDVRLPGGPDGVTLARRLRSTSDLPIMFLTAADGEEARVAGFEAGADDYLAKPFAMPELLLRVKALLRRAKPSLKTVLHVGGLVIDEAAHLVVRTGDPIDLTPTEFDLLVALAKVPGRVLTKRQLLDAVWGYDAYDANLVEVHVSSLRRKLEAHGPRLVHTVRGVGYVVRP